MSDSQLSRFKKLLKENKKSKEKNGLKECKTKKSTKKRLNETLLLLASFHVYKIGSFTAAHRYAKGCKWSLCLNEDAYNAYTKDYDFYIIHCGDTGSYAILTNKDTYKVREIRNKSMERFSVEELLERFNRDDDFNKGENDYTIEKILDLAIYKE